MKSLTAQSSVQHKLMVALIRLLGRFSLLIVHHFPYNTAPIRTVLQTFHLKIFNVISLSISYNNSLTSYHQNLPPYKSKKSPLFCILMCVTSWPRRTDNVNAPGLDDERRAKNEPSKPRSKSKFSASTPLMDGWNHLHRSITNKTRASKITRK